MHQVSRRAFIQNSSLILLSGISTKVFGNPNDFRFVENHQETTSPAQIRFGVVTDLHYADKPAAGNRHYRDTLKKLSATIQTFQKEKPSFVVELGDFIDRADSVKKELSYLTTIQKLFATLKMPRYYVLGNHCVDTLTKKEFLAGVGQEKSYYSVDHSGYHFVFLDACFRKDHVSYGRKNFVWTDTNIPPEELKWLAEDLKKTKLKTVVFTHQRLDDSKSQSILNRVEVRKILEDSKKVLAVIQGHAHENSHTEIQGIHYCVLVAMVSGSEPKHNAYSMLEIFPDETIRIKGYLDQPDYDWKTKQITSF